ncbi:MAG: HD domain-containing protein [Clostridia bacterium]|nr:HD domain-containing protein [Clostridia bacterium]
MVTFSEIKDNPQIKTYISTADKALSVMGFTEHSFPHSMKVAEVAKYILSTLGYSQREIELAQIASYLHDIGNLVNRIEHAQSGAVMAFRILDNLGMPPEDISIVVSAIGNHDESTAFPVNAVAAALILADKTDVRRSRVRNATIASFDIHDRVNYSVQNASVVLDDEKKVIALQLDIDTEYGTVMDYFEIFLNRMILCRKAAEKLNLKFRLIVNKQRLL